MIRAVIEDISTNYLIEKNNELKDNRFAQRVKNSGQEALKNAVGDDNLKYQASIGAGNWAEIPWLGVFNAESTTSATSGVYVVYLFSADMQDLYLCQGQGVTRVKEEFGRQQLDELERRSDLIRARVPEHKINFKSDAIDLRGSTKLAKEYNSAVAYYKHYNLTKLPKIIDLENDLREMVRLYGLLILRGGTDNLESFNVKDDLNEDTNFTIEEQRRYVRHMKIERNASAARKAKSALGYICQGCGIGLENIYGETGKNYIEAHHLIPLHTLDEGKSVKMNVLEDFAVLCANCHKMVHRAQPMLSIEQLRQIPGVKMLRKAFENKFKRLDNA